jgi:hypothetical protein
MCLPWLHEEDVNDQTVYALISDMNGEVDEEEQPMQHEVAALLKDVGLDDVAHAMADPADADENDDPAPNMPTNISPLTPRNVVASSGNRNVEPATSDREAKNRLELDPYTDENGEEIPLSHGIALGQQPNTLCLRGWLAGIDVRAMALFEYLACKRRQMPFGSDADVPYGTYCGYLTPDETRQLASVLRGMKPCSQTLADADYERFCREQLDLAPTDEMPHLIDEVLPSHSREFLGAVRRAALQGLGLICSIE